MMIYVLKKILCEIYNGDNYVYLISEIVDKIGHRLSSNIFLELKYKLKHELELNNYA